MSADIFTYTNIPSLVIGAVFWPAYVGAVHSMAFHPHLFVDREERIDLHKRLCRVAKDLAQGKPL